jgi:hypothetical protein
VIPSWSDLREIGNSRPAKLSFAFPVIGYLVLFNRWVNEWMIELGLPSIGSLIPLLYFGLLAFSAASIIFGLFCPKVVKRNGNVVEFISDTEKTVTANEIQEYCDIVSRLASNTGERESAKGIANIIGEGGIEAVVPAKVLGIRKAYFLIQADRYPAVRAIATALYAAGFLLLASISIDGVKNVVSSL